jgi:hypothetical protein
MLLYGLLQNVCNRLAVVLQELGKRRSCATGDGDADFIEFAEDRCPVTICTRETEF